MFLTSRMSMRRTERRSFWPVFMAVFMSSCNRANSDIVAPDGYAGGCSPVARFGGACLGPQVRYPIVSPVGLHVCALEGVQSGNRGKTRWNGICTAFYLREGPKVVRQDRRERPGPLRG